MKLIQPTLTGGELSPSCYARVDLARYATSLKTCENFIVRPYGGITNRAGLHFEAEAKYSDKATRVIPFEFSEIATYVVELGDYYARFYAASGGRIESAGVPVEVETPWPASVVMDVNYTQSADTMTLVHPDYPIKVLVRTSATEFTVSTYKTLKGPFRSVNSDDSINVWSSAQGGEVTITASSAIFETGHVGGLFYIEARDYRSVPPWEPSKGIAFPSPKTPTNPYGLLRRSEGKIYRCVTNRTATTDRIQTGTIRPTHDKGIQSDGDGGEISGTSEYAGVEWEFVCYTYGIVEITEYTSATSVKGIVILTLPHDVVGGAATPVGSWSFTGNGSSKNFTITGASSTDASMYIVTIDGVTIPPYTGVGSPFAVLTTNGYSIDATNDKISFVLAPRNGADIEVTERTVGAYTKDGRTPIWAFGAFSTENGYPREVEYFSDRLVFAGTRADPQALFLSETGNYASFGKNAPLLDTDSIAVTLNSRQVNVIRELVPMGDLVVMTAGGIWRVEGGDNNIITPSDIGFKPQSYDGAARLSAQVINNSAIYVKQQGQKVFDLNYHFEDNGYKGDDLTALADHLVEGYELLDICYAQAPFSNVLFVRDDGQLLCLTYMREQEVVGWSRLVTDGIFESVCSVANDTQSVTWVVVKRVINGETKRFIERFATRLFDNAADFFFVDSGLTYDGTGDGVVTMDLSGGSTWASGESLTLTASSASFFGTASDVGDEVELRIGSATVTLEIIAAVSTTVCTVRALQDVPVAFRAPLTNWILKRDVIGGLSHLEGEEVSILSDGDEVLPRLTVVDGQVHMTRPGGIVHVGLPYTSLAETLEINIQNAETIRSKKKIITSVDVHVRDSRGFKAGPTADKLVPVRERTEAMGVNQSLSNGVWDVGIQAHWSEEGRVMIVQESPLPLTILSIAPNATIGG